MARKPAEVSVRPGVTSDWKEPSGQSIARNLAGPSPQRERSQGLQFGWKPPRHVAGSVPRIPFTLGGSDYNGTADRPPVPVTESEQSVGPAAHFFSLATTAAGSSWTSLLQPLQQRKKVWPAAVTLSGTPIEPRFSPLTGQRSCLSA